MDLQDNQIHADSQKCNAFVLEKNIKWKDHWKELLEYLSGLVYRTRFFFFFYIYQIT